MNDSFLWNEVNSLKFLPFSRMTAWQGQWVEIWTNPERLMRNQSEQSVANERLKIDVRAKAAIDRQTVKDIEVAKAAVPVWLESLGDFSTSVIRLQSKLVPRAEVVALRL